MKKILIVLLAVVLLCVNALALEGKGYPAWEGGNVSADSLCGTLDGEKLRLSFDPSAEFSMSYDNYLQICFYAMGAPNDNYIELYLVLPLNTQSGDVITPDFAIYNGLKECSVSFYEVIRSNEDFYVAMQDSAPYPESSSYEIVIDSFTENENSYTVRGTVNAVLAQLKDLLPTGKTVALTDASFDFTLPKANVEAPLPSAEPTPEPSDQTPFPQNPFSQNPFEQNPSDGDDSDSIFEFFAGDATSEPEPSPSVPAAPLFTLPPDYARI